MDPKNMELVSMGLRDSSSDSNLPVLKVFLITQQWTVSPHRQHSRFRLRVLILLENIFLWCNLRALILLEYIFFESVR